MRKIVFGVIITLVILFTFKYCDDRNEQSVILKENSALIEKQIKNVGKLVVTEGHFSEVMSYENSKEILDLFEAEKKALVVVNAKVSIAYDLSKIEYAIDEETKTLKILSIPEEELIINPDIEYYDIQSDFFNQFEAQDYNKISEIVRESLEDKINKSELKSNAKNRLLSELSKFYILTNSLGWTLIYETTPVENIEQLYQLKL